MQWPQWPRIEVPDILIIMSATTLREIQASVEKLDLLDQVTVLEYLTPKIASAVLASPSSTPRS